MTVSEKDEWAEIPLTQGKVAIVDPCDSHLAKWKWSAAKDKKQFYARRVAFVSRKGPRPLIVYLHHAIIGKPIKKGVVVDHINGNPMDNRRSNLRFIDIRQNCINRKNRREGRVSSKYVGVSWSQSNRRWVAQITTDRKYRYLGVFKSEEEAANAYRTALNESRLGGRS